MIGVDLFPDAPAASRPAWQVIDAARRAMLTGELTLHGNPAVRVYLRDGIVYFAERATDGSVGVRLLVEGVITRAQMSTGTVVVNGTEHLGRLFTLDPSVDRAAVELCVELFADDVLTSVADQPVSSYEMALYRRHPSGIDRWYPHTTHLVTRVVDRVPTTIEPTTSTTVVEPAHEPAPIEASAPVVVSTPAAADILVPVAAPVAPAPAPVVAPTPAAVVAPTPAAVVAEAPAVSDPAPTLPAAKPRRSRLPSYEATVAVPIIGAAAATESAPAPPAAVQPTVPALDTGELRLNLALASTAPDPNASEPSNADIARELADAVRMALATIEASGGSIPTASTDQVLAAEAALTSR